MDTLLKHGNKYFAINYEGGKIIEHALMSKMCVAYANIQIAMDAPYDNIVATEENRSNGPMEKTLAGYDHDKLISKLKQIFGYVIGNHRGKHVVIQIARGKSANETKKDIQEIINNLKEKGHRCTIQYGYKTTDYFELPQDEYVFINIGMMARLTNSHELMPGEVCNPVQTFDLAYKENKIVIVKGRNHTDGENILNTFDDIPKIILFGIADNMPFVTPTNYPKSVIQALINEILSMVANL
jgi:hypothetical protein